VKVVIDVHTFSPHHPAGVSLYIANLLMALSRVDERNRYVVLADAFRVRIRAKVFESLLKVCGSNFEIYVAAVPGSLPRRFFDAYWFGYYLPRFVGRERADVLFAPDFLLPRRAAAGKVATIHDLVPLLFPELSDSRLWYSFRRRMNEAVASGAMFMADSRATADDMRRLLGVSEDRVKVVHLAPDEAFVALDRTAARKVVGEKFGVADPFLLSVGTMDTRKNLRGLLRAFALARRRENIPHILVLVGRRGRESSRVARLAGLLGVGDAVRVLGYVGTSELVELYNAAEAMLYPSFYEGFGLPVVEAMACGTPVLTSPRGALKEVAGGAALMADPDDYRDICNKLLELVSSENLRAELSERGLKRSRAFSWDETARRTLEVLKLAARG